MAIPKIERAASIRIAETRIEHTAGIQACHAAVAKEKKFDILLESPPSEFIRAYIEQNLKNGQIMLVLLDGDKVAGWCEIIRPWLPTVSHVGTLGIGLLPEYRGKGLAKRIMTSAIRRALAAGIERVELTVFETNKNAIALFRSLGFVAEGKMSKVVKIEGTYFNSIMMALFKGKSNIRASRMKTASRTRASGPRIKPPAKRSRPSAK